MGQQIAAGQDGSSAGIRRVTLSHPLRWLTAGWRDVCRTPIASIAYGLLFSLGGDAILVFAWQSPQLFVVAVSGFVLVSPILAAGLYELSRRTERGEASRFVDSLTVFARGREGLALFSLLVVLLWVAWERFSAVMFSMMLPAHEGLNAIQFVSAALGGTGRTELALAWLIAGGALAFAVFAISIISVPLLIDRNSDFISAAMTSLRVLEANLLPMLLWAFIIAVLTLAGFATLLFGFIILMPILGHASWHAYRDLVE
jgi:uncharacterized membrane protein